MNKIEKTKFQEVVSEMIKIGPLLCSVFGPSGRTVGPIVIKFEIVPFEAKLVISYKYELNRTKQNFSGSQNGQNWPFFLTVLALAAERLGRL